MANQIEVKVIPEERVAEFRVERREAVAAAEDVCAFIGGRFVAWIGDVFQRPFSPSTSLPDKTQPDEPDSLSDLYERDPEETLSQAEILKLGIVKKKGIRGKRIGASRREFKAYRLAGHFPDPVLDEPRRTSWRVGDVIAWHEAANKTTLDEFLKAGKEKDELGESSA